jgi:hypothetical protein
LIAIKFKIRKVVEKFVAKKIPPKIGENKNSNSLKSKK